MKKQMRRGMSALLVLLMVSSLAACGGNSDSAGTFSKDGKKVLKVAHVFSETGDSGTDALFSEPYQWILKAKEEFEEKYPDYVVELEYIDANNIDAKMMSDAASGISHDVVMTQSPMIAQHMKSQSLYNIEEFYNGWSQEEQEDFNWNPVWDNLKNNGEGLYAIPFGLHTRTLAYRKSYFKDAGLDPDSPPKTFDEVVEYAKKLTDAENDRWGLGIYLGPHMAACEAMMALTWSRGGAIFDDASGKATFTDPACVEAVNWVYDCVYNEKISPSWTMSGDHSETLLSPFLEGKFAMAYGIGNYWLADTEKTGLTEGAYPASSEVDGDVTWCVIPEEDGSLYCNAWCLGIHANTSDAEASMHFIECALDPSVIGLSQSFGGLPARASEYEGDIYSADFWQTWFHMAVENGHCAPETPYFSNLSDALVQAVQEIMLSEDASSIEGTLKQYEDDFNSQYAE